IPPRDVAGRPRPARRCARGPAHAAADTGRAGGAAPGPPRRQRARGAPRAVARDRPEAARRRAGVCRWADRTLVRARSLEAGCPPPLRPPDSRARTRLRARPRLDNWADGRVDAEQRIQIDAPGDGAMAPGGAMKLEAVVFDVDFTLAKPGPDLGPEGYRRLGERFGLELEPARYEAARPDAIATLNR